MLAVNPQPDIHAAAIRMATIARGAGVPEDSLRRFLSAGYVPQPKQMEFHAACRKADEDGTPNDIGYGGALAGGKTHCAFAQIAIDDCQRFPNLKVLFLRKIGRYARESLEDLRRAVLSSTPHEFANNIIRYKNESRIIIGAYQYEKDIDNYLSLEYDIILIEQAEQLSGKKLDLIRTRNRSSKGFRPRMYYTFNPGGVGHAYLKERFIKPFRQEREVDTKFIFANYKDNCFVNKEYQHTLDTLTGWQKSAWRDGDWDIAAGQFFTTWNYDFHVVEPFDVSHLDAWGGFDYGFTHMTTCYPMAMYDGDLLIIGEHAERKRLPSYHAEKIKEMGTRLELNPSWLNKIYAGRDVFASKGDEQGKTIADQYKPLGIRLLPANMDRVSRAGELLSRLGDMSADPPIAPTIKIFNTCQRLIECIPNLQHDPHRPEDVLKVDADEDGQNGDDPYDGAGYGWMARKIQRSITL